MLDRRADRRHAATDRQRRYRRRLREGTTPVTVEADAAIVTMLVATEWLAEADSGDQAAIGRAITAMLCDAAAKFR